MKKVEMYSTPSCHYCNLAKDFFDETAEIDFSRKIRQKNSIRPSQIQITNAKKSVIDLTGVNSSELLEMIQTLQNLLGIEESEKKQIIQGFIVVIGIINSIRIKNHPSIHILTMLTFTIF